LSDESNELISQELKTFLSTMIETFGNQLRQERTQSMLEIQSAFRQELDNIKATLTPQLQVPSTQTQAPYQQPNANAKPNSSFKSDHKLIGKYSGDTEEPTLEDWHFSVVEYY
jgi:hypothetical protein